MRPLELSNQTNLVRQGTEPFYRPDIDGLRAFAVVAVILFHAWPEKLSGGFLGVDVFFVISGFLISSIILSELEDGKFSLWHFYARRARRIFPALAIVLIATAAAGWLLLLPDEYRLLGRHLAAGSLFSSNLLLWREAGYFDKAAELKPLLHLWSLGVEEQFYLLWPLALTLIWKMRGRVPYVVFALMILSFALNFIVTQRYPEAAFYCPLTRFWEIMAGALLASLAQSRTMSAYWLIGPRRSLPRDFFREAAALTGAAAIVTSVAFLSNQSGGGWRALFCVVGTILIIAAGPSTWVNRTLLANRAMVFVGLISYALYLWHWPMLSFLRIVGSDDDGPNEAVKVVALGLSCAAAALTYIFVERSARRRVATSIAPPLIAAICVPLLFGVVLHKSNGLYGLRGPWDYDTAPTATSLDYAYSTACFEHYGKSFEPQFFANRDFCIQVGPSDQAKKLILVGDSHAKRLLLGLGEAGLAATMIGRGSCVPFIGYDAKSLIHTDDLNCMPTVENLLYEAVAEAPETIVLHGFFNRPFDGRMRMLGNLSFKEIAATTLAYLSKNVAKVVVVLDIPELPFAPSSCLRRPFQKDAPRLCDYNRNDFEENRRLYEADLRAAAAGLENVVIIDPWSVFCSSDRCIGARDGKLLYEDPSHLTADGARLLGQFVKDRL